MTETKRGARAASLAEKTILGFIAGAAAAIALIDVVGIIARTVTTMTADAVTVRGMALADPSAERIADAPSVIDATFDSVTLSVEGLSTSPRVLLAIADMLGVIGVISLCVVVAWLCVRIFTGRPFTKAATWGIASASLIVMFGGLMSQAVRANAYFEITDELSLETVGLAGFEMSIDLAPLGWGFALAVIAGAFEIGQRMQRDTDGLV
jgi:hypothetical protein